MSICSNPHFAILQEPAEAFDEYLLLQPIFLLPLPHRKRQPYTWPKMILPRTPLCMLPYRKRWTCGYAAQQCAELASSLYNRYCFDVVLD